MGVAVGVQGSPLRAKCRRLRVLSQGGGPWANGAILSRSFSLFSGSLHWLFSPPPHTVEARTQIFPALVGREAHTQNPHGGRKDVLSDGRALQRAEPRVPAKCPSTPAPPHLVAHACESARTHAHAHAPSPTAWDAGVSTSLRRSVFFSQGHLSLTRLEILSCCLAIWQS